jgi:Baseplate J-like protein
MSCTGGSNCDCGCCSGITVLTPQAENNRPGLSSISYRVGRWATFKESMLARLSSSDYPALTALKTRDDDDFTVAFLDATSVVLDILTFYQERLANESYLRTAGQLRSLTELSRLIGYEPAPGVSASTYLAFSLKAAPGQTPDPSAPAITIPAGSQVQSVPAQGQKPQTFETSADIPAKPDWNALPVRTGTPWMPQIGDIGVYLQGIATQLQPGDLILIVGDERAVPSATNTQNENWDIRLVTTVKPDTLNNRTWIAWSEGLGYAPDGIEPAQEHPRFFAFRQRASLFGYNALNPQMLSAKIVARIMALLNSDQSDWIFAEPGAKLVDLDATYSKLIAGGWIALNMPDKQTTRSPSGFLRLYQIESVTVISRSNFSMSAKISRLETDTDTDLPTYYAATRKASVLAQSEELAVAEQPLAYPLYGTALELENLRPDLLNPSVVALSGKRQKLSVVVKNLSFAPDDNPSDLRTLNPGDLLTLTDPTPLPLPLNANDWNDRVTIRTLNVEDDQGRPGTLDAHLTDFTLAPSSKSDPDVSESALVESVSSVSDPYPHTLITLQSGLANCYERAATSVNANVALATHGQSVSEVMGSGSASTPNQNFVLKQSPLTYVQAPTPTGRQSTLQVEVSGVKWTEVPSLYKEGASQQVFATLNQSDATTNVLFGDGVEGATLPTGQNNLQANYRIGSGSAGNVAAAALTTLMDRPLGVSGVTNPEPATGGQDPQSIDDVRSNAPQTVLTLGRAVSITDYQSYAAIFAGIAKAYAIWIPAGPGRGVFLTIAGVAGAALPAGNPSLTNLVTSLRNFGNPLIPITVQSFLETLFGLSADVQYDPAYDQPTVRAQVMEALTQEYSFAQRTFGQGVSVDEVATVIQAVPGVVAVNVKEIHTVATSAAGDLASQSGAFSVSSLNNWLAHPVTVPRPFSDSPTRICAYLPVADLKAVPLPAEILVLDPDPSQVVLGVMS